MDDAVIVDGGVRGAASPVKFLDLTPGGASGTPDEWIMFRAAGAAAIRELDVMAQLGGMARDAMASGDLERMLAARDLLCEYLAGSDRDEPAAAAAGKSS